MVHSMVLRTASTRRLIAASAAVVVLAVLAVQGATPAFAATCGGGQGQALLLGCDSNASTDTTIITVPTNDFSALWVKETGTGSWGIRADGTDRGVVGSGDEYGLYGSGGVSGVYGSGVGVGVYGSGGSTGVSGSGSGSGSTGVSGGGDTGVFGSGSTIGVRAYSSAPGQTGVGLKVEGRSVFQTAGAAVVPSGASKVTVTLAGVSPSDFVLATAQGNPSGLWVKSASAGTGQFTIRLNKAPTSPATVTVAYFVISAS